MLRLYVVGIAELVVLEVIGPTAAPRVSCSPDERCAEGAHGLVDLGARDQIDEPFVVFQGLGRMSDLYVKCPSRRDCISGSSNP